VKPFFQGTPQGAVRGRQRGGRDQESEAECLEIGRQAWNGRTPERTGKTRIARIARFGQKGKAFKPRMTRICTDTTKSRSAARNSEKARKPRMDTNSKWVWK